MIRPNGWDVAAALLVGAAACLARLFRYLRTGRP